MNWLYPSTEKAFFWRGFAGVETEGEERWSWSIGGECSLRVPADCAGVIHYTFVVPVAGTSVEIHAAGTRHRTILSSIPWQEISGTVELSSDSPLRFVTDRWNGNPSAFAPEDSRAIALYFKALNFSGRKAG